MNAEPVYGQPEEGRLLCSQLFEHALFRGFERTVILVFGISERKAVGQ